MKIVVDAFGGDYAPQEIVLGCIEAVKRNPDVNLVLAGDKDQLEKEFMHDMYASERIEIIHAPDIISNNDHPAMAIKNKPSSSIVVAYDYLRKNDDAIGLISAGSTGATLTGAILKLGRIKNVSRPALAPILPTMTGGQVLLCDCLLSERRCTMNENRIDFVKWLRVLIYIAIARIINTLVGIPAFIPTALTAWISRILMAGMVFAMFKLSPANDRYKKTGIQLAVVLVLTIATELFNTGAVLTLIAGILSIVAEYQEYHGHSELIEEKDHQLSGKWTSLFMWSIVIGLILGFASTAAGVLAAVAGVDTETAALVIAAVMMIPEYIIDIFYILYLKKMIALFEEDKVSEYDA